jgi:hypothetical protein
LKLSGRDSFNFPAERRETLGDVARARGMTEIAREAGISREAMYKAFRPEGNPTLETLARAIRGSDGARACRASPNGAVSSERVG